MKTYDLEGVKETREHVLHFKGTWKIVGSFLTRDCDSKLRVVVGDQVIGRKFILTTTCIWHDTFAIYIHSFSRCSLTRSFVRLPTYTCLSSTRNRNNPVEDTNIMMASVKDSVA